METQPPESAAEPPRKRAGAPLRNRNRTTHGLRATALPSGCAAIAGECNAFRRMLFDELEAIHGAGQIPVAIQTVVQSIMRHEQAARLAGRWLRQVGEASTLDDRLKLLATIRASTESRDKAIARLGIDKPADHPSTGSLLHFAPLPSDPPAAPAAESQA